MSSVDETALDELASVLRKKGARDLLDLYLERRVEWWWQWSGGGVSNQRTLLSDGVAVRRDGTSFSCDGLDRQVVADLTGVPLRRLPVLPLPPYPARPEPDSCLATLGGWDAELRIIWRSALVASPTRARLVTAPSLCELRLGDGRSRVCVWPAPPSLVPPRPSAERPGKPPNGTLDALLAPQAAAVLLHELFGHPLEGDTLLRGGSPWAGRQGERVVPCDLDIVDDPLATGFAGSFDVDDEGAVAGRKTLLSAGVLVGALADRSCADALGVAPGNARRSSVHTPPRPRISNLIATVRGGLAEPPRAEASFEVEEIAAGTIEPRSGTVILQVRSATQLRRGARQRTVGAFTLLGELRAVCDGMVAVATATEEVFEPGWCGKDGEVVPTGASAPWLLVHGLEAR
jgi:hypothetical protein